MKIPESIFKKYDIRGISGEEITEDLTRAIGKAFATLRQSEISEKNLTIAVGRDMRETSETFQKSLMQGLVESGCDVVDIGLVSTPAFYFSVGYTESDGGIMVSASHNPAKYNGFKMTRENAIPVSGDTGIQTIADIIRRDAFVKSNHIGEIKIVEGIPEASAKMEFELAQKKLSAVGGSQPQADAYKFGGKIVADASNGMGSQYLDYLFSYIEADITRIFWELDGTFPNHEADPLKKENLVWLQKKVLEIKADIGICTDGDGDRIFFVDDVGEIVEPAIVRGLLAQINLRKYPGATICYDVRPGKITKDMIVEFGGVPVMTPVGHSLIKEVMRENKSIFGGESSGHFYYANPQGVFECPLTVAAQILQEITNRKEKFSEIIKPLKKYFPSGEMNFTVKNVGDTLEKIKNKYSDGKVTELDGVSVEYQKYWFNVRGSNTEPLVRLNLEAIDKETMEQKRDEIVALINS